MQILRRVRLHEFAWSPLILALTLTALGLAFVISATASPGSDRLGFEARRQIVWLIISLSSCLACLHVPPATWKALVPEFYVGMFALLMFMMLMRGTALVPRIGGEHNWLVLGPLRVQPAEFYKIATILTCARLLSDPDCDPRRLSWVFAILVVGGLPAILLSREDLGSSLTFGPMLLGMLFFAGMRLRHLAALIGSGALVIAIGIARLPREGYQFRRIQAWLDPESFALHEAYQTIRAMRAVGSGRLLGKGYGMGEQNLLGYIPEKHNDMIFAVVGEETGFIGAIIILGLFVAFSWVLLAAAMRCRDPFGRFVIGGFACLVMGQVMINIMVVLGMMPVTGITLPFFSYGGSSLLATFTLLGICLSATTDRHVSLMRSQYG